MNWDEEKKGRQAQKSQIQNLFPYVCFCFRFFKFLFRLEAILFSHLNNRIHFSFSVLPNPFIACSIQPNMNKSHNSHIAKPETQTFKNSKTLNEHDSPWCFNHVLEQME